MVGFRSLVDRVRRQVNATVGLDIVRVSGQYTLSAHLRKVFEDYRVDAVIDVGANEGDFGALVRSVGFRGKIFSFEPVAAAFQALNRRAEEADNWQAFNFALGAEAGTAKINVSRFSQFSSIRPATIYGNSWENMEVLHQQDIEIRTLDEMFRDGAFGNASRIFLKMDTQGYDLEAFKGARDLSPRICCMLSELSLIPLYQGMPNYIEALETYNNAGFVVSGLYPVTRHASLALNEVDCVMVRPEASFGGGKPLGALG